MKSSFLLALLLVSVVSASAWGQTAQKKKKEKKTEVAPVVKTEEVALEKTHFQKFSDRLKISYFNAFQSSSLGQWDSTRAIDEKGQKITDPIYTFNQISFNYNFGWKMNFVVNPRWTNWFGSTKHKNSDAQGTKGEVSNFFTVEDMLAGFQGVIYTSDDKKFNFWMRAGARLPTSRSSRNANITFQPDFYMNPTYDITKKWQIAAYAQVRIWVYEEKYTDDRYRIYTAPYIQYSLSDRTRLQLFYETYADKRGPKPENKRVLKQYWRDFMLGVNHDISPRVNFFPFLGYFADAKYTTQRPLDPAWIGFWFSWQIK